MSLPPLRTVIVEDEPLARLHLRTLIAQTPSLQLAGEAADGESAIALINGARPDLVFLDMQLPELHGLAVLTRLVHHPLLVWTTAFDRYALQAFELGAADYLLKPFSASRFARAIARVHSLRASEHSSGTNLEAVRVGEVYRSVQQGRSLARLYVRDGGRVVAVPTESIVRLEADDDYVNVITTNGRHLVTVTLSDLHAQLEPSDFVRIHRSHVVARRHIAALEPQGGGRWAVVLRNGERVVASRSGTRVLREEPHGGG